MEGYWLYKRKRIKFRIQESITEIKSLKMNTSINKLVTGLLTLSVLMLSANYGLAQVEVYQSNDVGIGTTAPPHNTVKLEIQSDTEDQGLLLPRVEYIDLASIAGNNPPEGLEVYAFDTDEKLRGIYVWNGNFDAYPQSSER